MAINFPNSPQAGDPHSEAGIDWVYDGEKWVAQSEATFWARTNSTLSPSTAGDNISTTGDLTAGCTTTGSSGSSGEAQVVGYQQGSWTPEAWTAQVATTATFDDVGCVWARIGNRVFLDLVIDLATRGDAADGSAFRIAGLPYAPVQIATSSAVTASGCVGAWGGANTDPGGILTTVNATSGHLHFTRVAQGGANNPTNFNWSNVTSSFAIRASYIYLTDDTTWTPSNGATIS